MLVSISLFSADASIEKVAGIKMDRGFGGCHLEDAAAGGIINARRQLQPVAVSPDHEILIVPARQRELLVGIMDADANRHRARKIERRSRYGTDFAGGDQRAVDWGEAIGM